MEKYEKINNQSLLLLMDVRIDVDDEDDNETL